MSYGVSFVNILERNDHVIRMFNFSQLSSYWSLILAMLLSWNAHVCPLGVCPITHQGFSNTQKHSSWQNTSDKFSGVCSISVNMWLMAPNMNSPFFTSLMCFQLKSLKLATIKAHKLYYCGIDLTPIFSNFGRTLWARPQTNLMWVIL